MYNKKIPIIVCTGPAHLEADILISGMRGKKPL